MIDACEAEYIGRCCGCFADRCLYCADPQRSAGGPRICWKDLCQALHHHGAPGGGPRPLAEASALLCARYPGLAQGCPEALAFGALSMNRSEALLFLGRDLPSTGALLTDIAASQGPRVEDGAGNDAIVDFAAAQLHATSPEAQAAVNQDDVSEVRMSRATHEWIFTLGNAQGML